MNRSISLFKFADMHVHLRDQPQALAPYTSPTCARCLVMPNVNPPLTSGAQFISYSKGLPRNCNFFYLSYLKCSTSPAEIEALPKNVLGVKLYPAGKTTNSHAGLTAHILHNPNILDEIFSTLSYHNKSLHVHAEMPGSFISQAEKDFIPLLAYAARNFPRLRIVVEHVTTAAMVDWIIATPQVLATITPQHLLYELSALFDGGLRPFRFCKPIYGTPADRDALWKAVQHERFMFGSDSAPHATSSKLQDMGCPGIWNAPVNAAVLTHLFDEAGLLYLLPEFTRLRADRFWDFSTNPEDVIILEEFAYKVPDLINDMPPLCAGETLNWGPSNEWVPYPGYAEGSATGSMRGLRPAL